MPKRRPPQSDTDAVRKTGEEFVRRELFRLRDEFSKDGEGMPDVEYFAEGFGALLERLEARYPGSLPRRIEQAMLKENKTRLYIMFQCFLRGVGWGAQGGASYTGRCAAGQRGFLGDT